MQSLHTALESYHARTMEALLAYLPSKEPRTYLYDLVMDYPTRPGKGLRPALCLAACGAFGQDIQQAVPSAVSLELFHNAFLVHDDIADEGEERRGLPTLHATHGVPLALNAGDAMNMLSMRPLMDNVQLLGPALAFQVFDEIEHMVHESVEGQAIELGWIRDKIIDLEDTEYLRMVLKKTGWYTTIHPLRIGAIIATGGRVDADRFTRFGAYLGAAFQIQDDVLNLSGDRALYGKRIGEDLLEGKRTLSLLHLLRNASPAERVRLDRFLLRPRRERRQEEVDWMLDRMDHHGSIAYARASAFQLLGAARLEFEKAFEGLPDSPHLQFLGDLVDYMVARDR